MLQLRELEIEGIGPWIWLAEDNDAWHGSGEEFSAIRTETLKHTKERRCIVQAGGCLGLYPRLWSQYFETVYTFEPHPENFHVLALNCQPWNIIKMNCALGNMAGTVALESLPENADNAGMHRIHRGNTLGRIPILRLDDMGLTKVDAIQLDCEGYEPLVIRGALDTIERCRPVLCIEAPRGGLLGLLDSLGYAKVGQAGRNPDVIFTPRTTS